ncbi:MAG TPA: hypothetical protein VJL58_00190 [Pyrinomonadaceae bacterium]|nr:hypothetical protein [Pyrinomonadaceae bacterium]
MRTLLLVVSIAVLFASFISAQTPSSFDLGSKTVKIPAPDGFTEITAVLPRVVSRLAATEDEGNEILAIHLPEKLLNKFTFDEERDLEFYAKASIARPAKTMEFTREMFAEYVAKMEKKFDTYLEPDGEMIQRIKGNAEKGITQYWGNNDTVALNQPKSLGFFDKGDDVFSAMLFINVSVGRKKYPLLVTTSSLNINNRLVFLYVYKMSASEKDAATLRTFTRSWTAAVLAAHK